MTSEQTRREKVTDARNIVVERERVPKMATHFESLAEKAREDQQYVPLHGEKEAGSRLHGESDSGKKRREKWRKSDGEAEKRVSQGGGGSGEARRGLSLEEISNLRGTAQQNSIEAIRAAEERHGKAEAAKDTTENAAGNVGEKAVAVEGGKWAAGFVGKVAAEVKAQAAVAGWGTTQYTLEKVAEITSSVAGYSSEKAVAAKDKVAGAGKTVVSYAGEKITAAKDAVVATEEKATEYAARKKAEAEKDLEARRASHEMGDGGKMVPSKEHYVSKEESEAPPEKFLEHFQGGAQEQGQQQQGSSILQAIGETILEISQTTKELLIGRNPIQVLERKHEAEFTEKPYPGAGNGT